MKSRAARMAGGRVLARARARLAALVPALLMLLMVVVVELRPQPQWASHRTRCPERRRRRDGRPRGYRKHSPAHELIGGETEREREIEGERERERESDSLGDLPALALHVQVFQHPPPDSEAACTTSPGREASPTGKKSHTALILGFGSGTSHHKWLYLSWVQAQCFLSEVEKGPGCHSEVQTENVYNMYRHKPSQLGARSFHSPAIVACAISDPLAVACKGGAAVLTFPVQSSRRPDMPAEPSCSALPPVCLCSSFSIDLSSSSCLAIHTIDAWSLTGGLWSKPLGHHAALAADPQAHVVLFPPVPDTAGG
ncbi:hypothetical protein AOLI_G00226820 [Acnodon oligacanthus]